MNNTVKNAIRPRWPIRSIHPIYMVLASSLACPLVQAGILNASPNKPKTETITTSYNTPVEHLTIEANHVDTFFKGSSLNDGRVLTPTSALNVESGAQTDHVEVVDGLMNLHGTSIANHTNITGKGMVEVFNHASTNNTLILGEHDENRWSLRLYQGGIAKNTELRHGTMIIENGIAIDTTINGAPLNKYKNNLRFYGGYMKNVSLNNGARMVMSIDNQYKNGKIDNLDIQGNSIVNAKANQADIGFINQTHIGNTGALLASDYISLNDTKIDKGGLLAIYSNHVQLKGQTLVQGQLKNIGTSNTINNQGQLIFDQNGNSQLDSNIAGSGNLLVQNHGNLILNGQNTFTGQTQIGSSSTSFNSGLEVSGQLTGKTYILKNGILAGSGTVGEVINQGTIRIGSLTPSSTQHFSKLTIHGNYHGQTGSQLWIRSKLGGNDSMTDQLIIDGGHVSGHTQVSIQNMNGLGGETHGNGIAIIQGKNQAKLGNDTFSLAKPVVAGAYRYQLQHKTTDQQNEGWFLSSHNLDGSESYRPEVPLFSSVLNVAGQLGINSLASKTRREGSPSVSAQGIWTRLLGLHLDQQSDQAGAPSYKGNLSGIQIGADFYQKHTKPLDQQLGFYTTAQQADLNISGRPDGQQSKIGQDKQRAYSLGLYWNTEQQNGWYSDIVTQLTQYKGHINSNNGGKHPVSGQGWLASIEAGKTIQLSPWFSLQPQAQLIYQNIQMDSVTIPNANIDFHHSQNWQARLGTNLIWHTQNKWQPYLSMNYWHQTNHNQLDFSANGHQTTISPDFDQKRLELGFGVSSHLTSAIKLYSQMSYQQSLEHNNHRNWQLSLGGMYQF